MVVQLKATQSGILTLLSRRWFGRTLHLLQRKARSGPLLALLQLIPVWEPSPRMFKTGKTEIASVKEAEVSQLTTDDLSNALRNGKTEDSPIWWRDSREDAKDKPFNGKISMLLRRTQTINNSKEERDSEHPQQKGFH